MNKISYLYDLEQVQLIYEGVNRNTKDIVDVDTILSIVYAIDNNYLGDCDMERHHLILGVYTGPSMEPYHNLCNFTLGNREKNEEGGLDLSFVR